jgi:hypothetical protein
MASDPVDTATGTIKVKRSDAAATYDAAAWEMVEDEYYDEMWNPTGIKEFDVRTGESSTVGDWAMV